MTPEEIAIGNLERNAPSKSNTEMVCRLARECLEHRNQPDIGKVLDELMKNVRSNTNPGGWQSVEALKIEVECLKTKYCPPAEKPEATLKGIVEQHLQYLVNSERMTSESTAFFRKLLDQLKSIE